MSLKIFRTEKISDYLGCYNNLSLPFDIESECWEYTYDPNEANIFVISLELNKKDIDSQINFLLSIGYDPCKHFLISISDLFHIGEGMEHRLKIINFYYEKINNKKICILHHNSAITEGENLIYYDIMFNRQKVYMTDASKLKSVQSYNWTSYAKIDNYKLNDIKPYKIPDTIYNTTLKYLAPMRIYYDNIKDLRGHKIYQPRVRYRLILYNFLLGRGGNQMGYLSNIEEGLELETETPELRLQSLTCNGGGTWLPIANKYYESSYWSTYVETLTLGNTCRSVTEKTFDPLIKGHFILPFGYQGLVSDIRNYGFILPNWIDYSFDNIIDNEIRFLKYLESLHNLLKLSSDELDLLYKKDIEILHHNKKLFFERPYDSLYNKISKWIKSFDN